MGAMNLAKINHFKLFMQRHKVSTVGTRESNITFALPGADDMYGQDTLTPSEFFSVNWKQLALPYKLES